MSRFIFGIGYVKNVEERKMISELDQVYGRASSDCLVRARGQGIDGARALLETFYYAFNNRDIDVFEKIWAEHDLIQLNNPLGGILRGYEPIATLYRKILNGPASVWVEFGDIVEFESAYMVVFAGRETGEFSVGDALLPLSIRTSRIIQWFGPDIGWRQVHHHGSIDDPQRLGEYQRAVQG